MELFACKRCSRESFSMVNAWESCLPGPSKGPWTAEGNTPHASPCEHSGAECSSISSFGFCTGVGLCRPQLVMNLRSKNSPLEEARTHLGEVIHFPVNGSRLMFCCYNHTCALIGEMSQNCKFNVLFLLQFMHLHILRHMDADIDFTLKLESLNQCLPSVHGADAAGIWAKCYNGPRKSVLLQGTLQCPNRSTELLPWMSLLFREWQRYILDFLEWPAATRVACLWSQGGLIKFIPPTVRKLSGIPAAIQNVKSRIWPVKMSHFSILWQCSCHWDPSASRGRHSNCFHGGVNTNTQLPVTFECDFFSAGWPTLNMHISGSDPKPLLIFDCWAFSGSKLVQYFSWSVVERGMEYLDAIQIYNMHFSLLFPQ